MTTEVDPEARWRGDQLLRIQTVMVSSAEHQTPERHRDCKVESQELSDAVLSVVCGNSDGILLTGPTGVGKSFQGFAALRAIANACPSKNAGKVVAITAPEMMARCRPGAEPLFKQDNFGNTYQTHDPIETFSKAGILLIDDLGAEKPSDWTAEVMYRIIDTRYSACRLTIAITNLTPPELAKHLGDRLASRLTEMCQTVVLKGSDRRRGK